MRTGGVQSKTIGSASLSTQPSDSIYSPHNSIVHNHLLSRQFNDFQCKCRGECFSGPEIVQYLNAQAYLKNCNVTVIVNTSRWPVAFQPATNNIVINPHLLSIASENANAKLFALTEIFDQVIYAQLHAEAHGTKYPSVLPEANVWMLGHLLDVKRAKQDVIKIAAMGSVDETEHAEPLAMVVDPYSAWLLASPAFVPEPVARDAFQRASENYSGDR